MSLKQLSYKTKPGTEKIVKRDWYIVDATDLPVGRICSKIASVLRGKNKAYYTPHFDCGDYVIVINSAKASFSGNKLDQKDYQHVSGYPGGQKHETARSLINRRPNAVIERAVKGMLPKNTMGRAMYKKLFVYESDAHPHTAQQPKEFKF